MMSSEDTLVGLKSAIKLLTRPNYGSEGAADVTLQPTRPQTPGTEHVWSGSGLKEQLEPESTGFLAAATRRGTEDYGRRKVLAASPSDPMYKVLAKDFLEFSWS